MTRLLWVTVAAAAASLALSASALAQFAPRLVVNQDRYAPNASAGTTEIEIIANRNESSIAKITIYTPPGYQADLGQATGTQIGTAQAQVQAKEIGENALLDITGQVVVGDRANATLMQQATACTGTVTHDAYWLLALQAAGTPLNIPMFVDRTSAPESAFSSYKIQVCFSSPEIPSSRGGAPFGAKILDAILDLRSVYTNPTTGTTNVWRGVFTPYTAGTATANPAGTVESRAIVSIPTTLTLKATYSKKTNRYTLTGKLSYAGDAIAGAPVQIFAGSKVSASALKRKARVRTNAKGAFTYRGKLSPRRTTFFFAAVGNLALEGSGGCGAELQALPLPCVTATTNDAASAVRKITPPKKR